MLYDFEWFLSDFDCRFYMTTHVGIYLAKNAGIYMTMNVGICMTTHVDIGMLFAVCCLLLLFANC